MRRNYFIVTLPLEWISSYTMTSSTIVTRETIESWLEPVLRKENLQDYSVSVFGNTEKGDNFLGDISFVQVRGKTASNEETTFDFVVKSGKNSAAVRELIPIRSICENEIYFYDVVLPVFIQFQEEKRVKNPFNNVPKCYGSLILENMEVLVLENKKMSGFVLHDKKHPFDKDHIRTVMKTYGKYHALSFALRDQKPDVFRKIMSNMLDINKAFKETIKRPEKITAYNDIINLAKAKNDFEIVEKAESLQEEMMTMDHLFDSTDPYAVILHGDCWNNNFMFKYDDDQKVNDVCFLDFQMIKLASPVLDLSYFLFTGISEEDVANFDEIIGVYYEHFSGFLRELGSDPQKLFPFEELLNQWKRFGRFGLMLLPTILKICLSDKEEVADFDDAADSGTNAFDMFSRTIRNLQEYEKRSFPVMRLAIDRKFI